MKEIESEIVGILQHYEVFANKPVLQSIDYSQEGSLNFHFVYFVNGDGSYNDEQNISILIPKAIDIDSLNDLEVNSVLGWTAFPQIKR